MNWFTCPQCGNKLNYKSADLSCSVYDPILDETTFDELYMPYTEPVPVLPSVFLNFIVCPFCRAKLSGELGIWLEIGALNDDGTITKDKEDLQNIIENLLKDYET